MLIRLFKLTNVKCIALGKVFVFHLESIDYFFLISKIKKKEKKKKNQLNTALGST